MICKYFKIVLLLRTSKYYQFSLIQMKMLRQEVDHPFSFQTEKIWYCIAKFKLFCFSYKRCITTYAEKDCVRIKVWSGLFCVEGSRKRWEDQAGGRKEEGPWREAEAKARRAQTMHHKSPRATDGV